MNNIIKRKWNKNAMVNIEDLRGMAFQAESGGHTFQISGIDGDGNPVALSGTPSGVMLRSDNQDVALTCSISNGKVNATLPANAYSVPGRFGITIFLTSDGQKTAIYAAAGTVGKTSSGTVAPPAGSDVVDLVNAIAAAVATIPASYTDLMAAMAPTYSSSGLYAVGSYAWYNGKLYRCTTAITSGETWTSGHWTLANLGSDLVDLKSALNKQKSDFYKEIGINEHPFTVKGITIYPSANQWITSANVVLKVIPVKAGDVVSIQRFVAYTTRYTVLKNLDGMYTEGVNVNYATGFSEFALISGYDRIDITIPSDGAYFVVIFRDGNGDRRPELLQINGLDYRLSLEDEIKTLKETVFNYASYDVLSPLVKVSRTGVSGINYVYNSETDTFAISGTASAESYHYISNVGTELPWGIIPGRKYKILYNSTNVSVIVVANKENSTEWICNTKKYAEFTVPTDAIGLTIYFRVLNGTVVSETVSPPQIYIHETQEERITQLESNNEFDVATGDMNHYDGDDVSGHYHVPSYSLDIRKKPDVRNKQIVAVNHDDLSPSDYYGTRRIYNKYGHRSNFNFILHPFVNKAEEELKCKEVKKMLLDGNDLGLHAILNSSYWTMDKMFDCRPNLTNTFAPTVSEMTTDAGSGKNVFGMKLTDTVSSCGYFVNPPSSLANTQISSLTSSNIRDLMVHYTLWGSYDTTYTGLGLDGIQRTYNALTWLEYWYNELIDNTMGYSYNSSYWFRNFDGKYDIPSGVEHTVNNFNLYYPSAENIISGHYVFFDDTDNPHYSDYQKVGRINKGLFKGCATVCNFEVIDRCIEIAKAFCRHYFGNDRFTQYSRHGVRFARIAWKSGKYLYDDRGLNILNGDGGKVFSLRLGEYVSEKDLFLKEGITNMMHTPTAGDIVQRPFVYGQVGFYYGQNNIRNPYFGSMEGANGIVDYLSLIGSSQSYTGEQISNEVTQSFIQNVKNLPKWAYENAGQQVTNGSGTSKYVHKVLKNCMNAIMSAKGTGKIPCLSFDTIVTSAADMAAVTCLSQFCYDNGIVMVPMEKARQIAEGGERSQSNYIANPAFSQTLLDYFGGASTSANAYIPDGWFAENGDITGSTSQVSVTSQDGVRILTVAPTTGNTPLCQRIWGLPAGKYKFSIFAKSSHPDTVVQLRINKNSDALIPYNTPVYTISPTSEFVEYEYEFTIPDYYRKPIALDDSDSVASMGYEDNVCCVFVRLNVWNNTSISIHSPKIVRI